MAKYILQEMNDIRNTGKRTVYPALVSDQTLTTEEFIDELHKHLRTVDKGVLTGVMYGIADTLTSLLSKGNKVTLDDIGTFSMSLQLIDDKPKEIMEEDDRMLYRRVGVRNVNFKASPQLLYDLKRTTKFERVMTGARVLKKNIYNEEQRIANALDIIDRKGFITLREYAHVNNLSRTTASKELSRLTSDPTSPIYFKGRASHKIWIRRT